MRVEHLYVHCIRPDRPDGTVIEDNLEFVPRGDLGSPDVRDAKTGEKLCSLPLYRTQYLDRLVESGRITYRVVRIGPWRRKEWLPAKLEVVLNDDLEGLLADPFLRKLHDAITSEMRGAALRELLDGIAVEFNLQPRSSEGCLAYWLLWGRLGLEDENDPVLVRERRRHPEGLDAIKARGRQEGLSSNYLTLGPEDVREDIVKRLAGYKVAVHTETDPQYDYLESEFDFVVEVANPNKGGESLELEFADEFTIFFGGTHVHCETNVAEYEGYFLKQVMQILEGKVSAVSAWVGDQWIGSSFTGRMLLPEMDWGKYLALFTYLPDDFVRQLKGPDAIIKVVNWLPQKSFQVRRQNR